jgi:hypothetical protein
MVPEILVKNRRRGERRISGEVWRSVSPLQALASVSLIFKGFRYCFRAEKMYIY